MERKVFLQILNLFKHIIEVKKSDGTTVKEKEMHGTKFATDIMSLH